MKFSLLLPILMAFLLGVGTVVLPPKAWGFKPPSHETLPDYDKRKAKPTGPLPADRAAKVAELRARVPGLQVDFDEIRGSPRRIASTIGFLSGPAGEGRAISPQSLRALPAGDPHRALKAFLNEHSALFGHGAEILTSSRLKRDDVSAHNGLRTVVHEQQLDQIAVYEALLIGHITQKGELVNLSSQFLPNLEQAANAGTPNRAALEAAPLITAIQAIVLAGKEIGEGLPAVEVVPMPAAAEGAEKRQKFKAGPLPGEAQVKLAWLPMDQSTLRLCWQVELARRTGGERFRVLIDAQNGEAFLRRCLTVYLSEASYRVFTGESPSPLSPSYPSPTTNQPTLTSRSLVTLSALFTNASPIGWISDGENETRGNNVDAHLDVNADDLPDLPRPHGNPFRVFDFPQDLSQAPATYRDASVVQLFYWCNWMHDQLYHLGFTEGAGNFQKDNFGRGGAGDDALQADAQDGSGFNNANFTPSDDGESPRIQMYLFSGPSPARDGDLDATIVLHEYTHGLSTRLVGGGAGISELQTAGMGEGWSDFYALTLLSGSGDDLHGNTVEGGYVTYQFVGLTENYYYGIRHYPYSTDMTKNPFTFKDIDPSQADPHSAVPISPVQPFDQRQADEVHHQGEVWCVTLGEARANLIQKYGFARGKELILQLVTDGMKLGPPNPNFLEARDAIIQADLVDNGGNDFDELWSAFAKRGMGFSATSPSSATTSGVHEAFDFPDALLITPSAPFFTGGALGGPLVPSCMTYALTNHTLNPLSWTAKATQPWLNLNSASGILAGRTATNITVCLTNAGKGLPLGNHLGSILFSNLTSGVGQSRDVRVRVMEFAQLPFVEDFESGKLQSYWMVTGTGPFRSQVTTNGGPHGGRFQLTMDSSGDDEYARNEVTLGLDLGGYSNVVLRFWAKEFGDEPDGPPPTPFIDGADFDGVAISQDGITWYEVVGLRDLQSTNAERVVDMDAAAAAYGLTYNSTFQVRFNQYDNYPIPQDGIGIDDISVTGVPVRRLIVSVPAEASEGDGTLLQQGRVKLYFPAETDLTVSLASSDTSAVRVPATVTIPAGATQAAFDVFIQDDSILDGDRTVLVSGAADGYFGQSAAMIVHDNERATLKVSLPRRAREGDGTLVQAGAVTLSAPPAVDVLVNLTSSDTNAVQVPAAVLIPARRTKAAFDLMIIDDDKLDGTRTVTITAHVEHWVDGHAAMEILDNEAPGLSLSLPLYASEAGGILTNAGEVRIPGTLATNLTVFLASSNATKLRVPASVVILAGSKSAAFDLVLVDNSIIDGPRLVTVTARAPGFGVAFGAIDVFDDETPPVPYQPSPANLSTGTPPATVLSWRGGVGEVLINGGFETGDFAGWNQENLELGSFVINDGTFAPTGGEGPVPPFDGKFCALSQQIGGGTHTLYQDVLIPADTTTATLSWVDRIRNHAGQFVPGRQEFRVEIRNPSNDVLALAYTTQPGDPVTNDWTKRAFDVTSFRGQVIRIAFIEEDHLGFFNLYLDEVSVLLGQPGPTTWDVYFGTNSVPGPGEFAGNTTNQNWVLPRLALTTTYFWRVIARRGAGQAAGPVWQFTTRGIGPLDHFEWSAIPPTQMVGQPFPVTLTAKDDIGNPIANFNQPVAVTALPGAGTLSAVVITEIATGVTCQVEFANVSGRPLDLSGWQVSAYDSKSWPSPRSTFNLPLHTLSAPGDVFLLNYSGTTLGAYPNFFAGTNLAWNNSPSGNPLAVLLRDASGSLVDFVCAFDANPAQITNPITIPPEEWVGNGIPANTNTGFTFQRVGQVDHNDGSDWLAISNSLGVLNQGLALPFAPHHPISFAPTNLVNFVAGAWSGNLVVETLAPGVTLLASDSSGHSGFANPFAVEALNDLSVVISQYPNQVIVGDDLKYVITVTNKGPMPATGVILEDVLPAEAAFVSSMSSRGVCANLGGIFFCNLGSLAGGDSATVEMVLNSSAAGLLTNAVTVSHSEADGYLPNNIASAVTAVNFPLVSIAVATVLEGNSGTTDAAFPLRLSAPCRYPVSVNYATSDGSARAGEDYFATNGTIFFAPGTTNQTAVVKVIGDTIYETLELFSVNLSSPSNATIGIGQARGRILNDDPLPGLFINDVTVTESPAGTTTNAVFTVRLAGKTSFPVTASFHTEDGTALAGIDYMDQSGLVTFAPGVTNQTISVTVNGNTLFKSNATFTVVLTNPTTAVTSRSRGGCTILDNGDSELDHFVWNVVPSPQSATVPLFATITAKDTRNRTMTSFQGRARLKAVASSQAITVGEAADSWANPLGTLYHDSRTQSIYLSGEIGSAGRITGLALQVRTPPGQTLSNWTVRLKHTPLSSYFQPAWEAGGWTTVYQKAETITAPGWVSFFFDTPFDYDGTNNLLLDLSFNNASYTTNGECFCTGTKPLRSLSFQTDSAFGSPLDWAGTNSPPPLATNLVPNIRLILENQIPMTPENQVTFVEGMWGGPVSIEAAASNLFLRVVDDTGHLGVSNPFAVDSALDANGDGLPDAWQIRYFGSVNNAASKPDQDPDGDGATNLEEFHAGTSPVDATSGLRLTAAQTSKSSVHLSFPTVSGKRYRLERTDELTGHTWTTMVDAIVGTGAKVAFTDAVGAGQRSRLYRLVLLE